MSRILFLDVDEQMVEGLYSTFNMFKGILELKPMHNDYLHLIVLVDTSHYL